MPLWKNTQHSFTAGQLDANVMGRQDMDAYYKGATLLKNFLVKRQGCISKRRGTDLVAELDGLLGGSGPQRPDGSWLYTRSPDKVRLVPVTNGDDGRYVILTGGLGFVANREGLLLRDGGRSRTVPEYADEAKNTARKDPRHSVSTPVDLEHDGTLTRYATLQAAFDAAASGDTIRLHADLLLTSSVTFTTEGAAKTVALDLYGYKITVSGCSGITASGNVTLTVDSYREGGEVRCCGTANADIAAFDLSSGATLLFMGSLYDPNQGLGAKYMALAPLHHVARALSGSHITVYSGTFTHPQDGCIFLVEGEGSGVTFTGGRFEYGSGTTYGSGAAASLDTDAACSVTKGEFSSEKPVQVGTVSRHTLEQIKASLSALNEAYPNADGYYGVRIGADFPDFTEAPPPTPYRFAVPYKDDDLAALCIRQSGDTLFIAHRNYPPGKIVFDRHGFADFEEISFDGSDYHPPVIESAVMEGQDPIETTWPSGFKNDYKTAAQALGTVTDAAKNTNGSTGSDGSSQTATTYQCTVENKDRANGKKVTTVLVWTETSSVAIEKKTVVYQGQIFSNDTQVTTTGSAHNRASATSVLVARTARYVATYVKNGKESRPSPAVSVDYDMPWANNAVVKLVLSKGANDEDPDYYNVYKDNGGGFGLIASTNIESAAPDISGTANTEDMLVPDPAANGTAFTGAAALEESKGWAAGTIGGRLAADGREAFPYDPADDLCLLSAPVSGGAAPNLVMSFGSEGARFRRIGLVLDGRLYDRATGTAYLVPSSDAITCTVTYKKADGTTATATKTLTAGSAEQCPGRDSSNLMLDGWYADWLPLLEQTVTGIAGTRYAQVYAVGKGDCTEFFNRHLRRVTLDLSGFTYASGQGISKIKSITSVSFAFGQSQVPQGCIHAIRFYNDVSASTGGNVQDDYINPDMTVSPPSSSTKEHFAGPGEYPGCVGVHEQRLVFASSRSEPSTIWMSRVADLYNFTARESIREDDALELTLAATEFPDVNHLVTGRDLLLFGDGGEWIVAPIQGNALTYKTASAKMQSMIGSSRTLRPLQLADETLFAERDGSCLRTINYNYASDSYQSKDLSVIAQSIFRANPIVSMAYKQHPDSIVECVLADGRVATLVYMKEQEVAAWSIQELGGGWKAKEIASPRCIVDGTTEMMLLVEKSGSFQLWKVRDDSDALDAADQVILDGMHVEDSAPADSQETSVALGDGTYAVGWPVVAEMVTVRPEPQKEQTVQMELKNATEAEIRVVGSSTFKVKAYAASSGWRDIPLPFTLAETAVTLADADCKRLLAGTNNRDGRLHVMHDGPWPLTILSVSTTYQIEYENGGGAE